MRVGGRPDQAGVQRAMGAARCHPGSRRPPTRGFCSRRALQLPWRARTAPGIPAPPPIRRGPARLRAGCSSTATAAAAAECRRCPPTVAASQSLVSHGDIRYEGTLYTVDMPNSTIALSNGEHGFGMHQCSTQQQQHPGLFAGCLPLLAALHVPVLPSSHASTVPGAVHALHRCTAAAAHAYFAKTETQSCFAAARAQ